MRKILLSGVALAALVGQAFAADLPSTKEAPVYVAPAPVFTWTGFYLGAYVGGVGLSSSNNYAVVPGNTSYSAGLGHDSVNNSGVLGGGELGYNYQINSIVLGLEADWGFADATAQADNYNWPANACLGSGCRIWGVAGAAKTQLSTLGTVRGRLGWALGHTLIYATGGLAYGQLSSQAQWYHNSQFTGNFGGVIPGGSSSNTGWVVGGGIEHALTDNFTIKAEALYADLGSNKGAVDTGLAPYYTNYNDIYSFKSNNSEVIARIGLNYKFGGAEPVVAKY